MNLVREVKKAQHGNVKAFETLITAHKLVMYQVAKTVLVDDADCADAIQEAILKAYEKLVTLREPKYFKTWLLRIVMNECNQIHRKRSNLIQINDWMLPSTNESGFERVELEYLLETLPEDDSRLLKLFHIEDISIQELADIYQVSENTIKTRLRRTREHARNIWRRQEGDQWKNGNMK